MTDAFLFVGGALSTIFFCYVGWIVLTVGISFLRKKSYAPFEPPISVIVPVFNEAQVIAATIESVFASTYDLEKLEVIVVDDGSTDETPGILVALQRQYPALRVVQGKHEGKSAALNLGLSHARHELFVGLDGDTVLDPSALTRIIEPLQDETVFASNGTCAVRNRNTILGAFQHLEYTYNNLLRKGFSDTFGTGIWFLGFFAAYRKRVIQNLGGFKKRSLTEDIDISLEMYRAGGRIIYVKDAIGYTNVPDSFPALFRQRVRWSFGTLQALAINRAVLTRTLNPSVLFIFFNQYWWVFFGSLFLPLLVYQLWIAAGFTPLFAWFIYSFLALTLVGPLLLIFMIPIWGISFYSLFGVTAVLSVTLIFLGFAEFKEKLSPRHALALFMYFPYTVFLALFAASGLVVGPFQSKYFIRESE